MSHTLLISSIDVASLKGAKASPITLKSPGQTKEVSVYQENGKYHVLDGADVVQALIELKMPVIRVQIVSKPVPPKPAPKPTT